jgi:hypothetical protein
MTMEPEGASWGMPRRLAKGSREQSSDDGKGIGVDDKQNMELIKAGWSVRDVGNGWRGVSEADSSESLLFLLG